MLDGVFVRVLVECHVAVSKVPLPETGLVFRRWRQWRPTLQIVQGMPTPSIVGPGLRQATNVCRVVKFVVNNRPSIRWMW
jgi:hypothetical protein